MKTKRIISELDINNGESITSNIDDGDDYWDFCGYLIKNPIYSISSKGSVYLEICGRPIYYTSIEESMDLETLENLSTEEEHLEFSCDHSKSYHAEPHKSISSEDIEKQYHEESDMMQLTKDRSQRSSSHIEVLYDLEQLRAYTMSYPSVSLDD